MPSLRPRLAPLVAVGVMVGAVALGGCGSSTHRRVTAPDTTGTTPWPDQTTGVHDHHGAATIHHDDSCVFDDASCVSAAVDNAAVGRQ